MSNIEKIRQEIERRLKYTHDWLRGDEKRHPKQTAISKNYYKMKGDERTLDALLAFIDSLPEEKPSDDLEEAAEKRKMGITPIGIIRMKVQELKWADVDEAGDSDIHPLEKDKYDYAIKQCDKIIAFIDNLPLTIAKESPVLNEAADDYQTTFNKTIGPFYHDDQKRAFIAGAEWQKEQMMKEAVEGKIYGYGDGSYELIASWLDLPKGGIYKDGDKVKIIIVKEDDRERD